jgi:hypothetical protein
MAACAINGTIQRGATETDPDLYNDCGTNFAGSNMDINVKPAYSKPGAKQDPPTVEKLALAWAKTVVGGVQAIKNESVSNWACPEPKPLVGYLGHSVSCGSSDLPKCMKEACKHANLFSMSTILTAVGFNVFFLVAYIIAIEFSRAARGEESTEQHYAVAGCCGIAAIVAGIIAIVFACWMYSSFYAENKSLTDCQNEGSFYSTVNPDNHYDVSQAHRNIVKMDKTEDINRRDVMLAGIIVLGLSVGTHLVLAGKYVMPSKEEERPTEATDAYERAE